MRMLMMMTTTMMTMMMMMMMMMMTMTMIPFYQYPALTSSPGALMLQPVGVVLEVVDADEERQ
jgi:hypothetical protein